MTQPAMRWPLAQIAGDIIAKAALEYVQTSEGGVRVEDYLAAVAALVGESVIVDAGVIDIEANDLTPGAAMFGDAMNAVLTGDALTFDALGEDTVMGIFVAELVPNVVPRAAVVPLEGLYAHVAASVGAAPWGFVAVNVGPEHAPSVQPIRAAFELRAQVVEAMRYAQFDPAQPTPRHIACTHALCSAFRQVQQTIDMDTATVLSLQVVFGMAKMVPMSRRAFEQTPS